MLDRILGLGSTPRPGFDNIPSYVLKRERKIIFLGPSRKITGYTTLADLRDKAMVFGIQIDDGDTHILDGVHLHSDVHISGGVIIGMRVSIGKGTFIGEGARLFRDIRIGENVTIDEMAIVHQEVVIEENTFIGEQVTIEEKSIIKEMVSIACNTVIGKHCVLLHNTTIGEHNMLGDHVLMCARTVTGSRVNIQKSATIGGESMIASELTMYESCTIKKQSHISSVETYTKNSGDVIIGYKCSNTTEHLIQVGDKTRTLGDWSKYFKRCKSNEEIYPLLHLCCVMLCLLQKTDDVTQWPYDIKKKGG